MSSIFQQIYQAQSIMQYALLALPNVVGVAAGYKESGGVITDEPSLVVMVDEKRPVAALSESERVPREINGVRTDVYEAGRLRAFQSHTDRFRPMIPGGVSIGHYKITAGTLGGMVRDRTTGERFILSNNHVLANSNEALVGDAILQPGPTDGGQQPEDVVARLERFIELRFLEGPITPTPPDEPQPPIPAGGECDAADGLVAILNLLARFSGSAKRLQAVREAEPMSVQAQQSLDNVADCALARPVDDSMFNDQILDIGVVRETRPPLLGMRVKKSGRTTELTEGTITLLNATVNVAYITSAGDRTARFTGQVITEPMSQGGDSGSLIVDAAENRAVGQLFGGSPLATIFTPIDTVLNALNVEFGI